MLTRLGRFLKKLRIDNGEILKNMADKFNVTASYLSAVENGKRAFPNEWREIVIREYNLDYNQQTDFDKAILDSLTQITINTENINLENKELTFAFARKIAYLPTDKLNEIKKILGGDNN